MRREAAGEVGVDPIAVGLTLTTPHGAIVAVMVPVVPDELPPEQLVPYLHYNLNVAVPA